MSLILKKKVPFGKNVSISEKMVFFGDIFTEKGLFSGASSQRFLIKGVFFPREKSVIGVFL